eukprot:1430284-Prymnesium_polylepis.2
MCSSSAASPAASSPSSVGGPTGPRPFSAASCASIAPRQAAPTRTATVALDPLHTEGSFTPTAEAGGRGPWIHILFAHPL